MRRSVRPRDWLLCYSIYRPAATRILVARSEGHGVMDTKNGGIGDGVADS